MGLEVQTTEEEKKTQLSTMSNESFHALQTIKENNKKKK